MLNKQNNAQSNPKAILYVELEVTSIKSHVNLV